MSNLLKQLEELDIIRCSLLPGEELSLVLPPDEREQWQELIKLFSESSKTASSAQPPPSPCRFQIKVENAPARVEIEFPREYPGSDSAEIYVRGDDIDRAEQEQLLQLIKDAQEELRGTDIEYPMYNLVSSTVLPLLHEKADSFQTYNIIQDVNSGLPPVMKPNTEPIYHALFTSHHLVSPTKRRNLQKWASDLSLHGFAKVGYPGCIYCEGQQPDVEEFVANVKAMQWLALRLRFMEPLEERYGRFSESSKDCAPDRRWIEFEKVGEVVEFMRQIERENFVTEMGLQARLLDDLLLSYRNRL